MLLSCWFWFVLVLFACFTVSLRGWFGLLYRLILLLVVLVSGYSGQVLLSGFCFVVCLCFVCLGLNLYLTCLGVLVLCYGLF